MAAAGIHHALALCSIHGHGLLAKHVLAVFGRFDGVEAMQENRRGEIDGVDFRIGKDFSWIRAPLGDAMPLVETPRAARVVFGSKPAAWNPAAS